MNTRKFVIGLLAASSLSAMATDIIIPEGYGRLVFQDEFNCSGMPDTTKWGYEKGYLRNGEKQYYTVGRRENCYVEDGRLHIVARNDSAMVDGDVRPVTSTSLFTKGKHFWKYCYVEVRAKLPSCRGTWPAIWMMPEKSVYGRWPKSGEIDIMEHVGYAPEHVHYAAHSEKYNHVKGIQKNTHVDCGDAADRFHVYGLEWTEDEMTWILDGKRMFTVARDEDGWEAWPFDQEFYLILNLAFGGGWGGQQGIDLTKLPQVYEIDYVRVFQR